MSPQATKRPAFRYHKVYEQLSNQVKSLPEGTKLPTVRELMAAHDVSLSTIGKALDTLRQEGWIDSQTGRGTYVTHPARGDKHLKQVDIIYYGYQHCLEQPSFMWEGMDYLSRMLGEHNIGVRMNTLAPESREVETEKLIDRLSPQAVIAYSPYSRELSSILEKRKIPFVQLHPNWPTPLPNSVICDNRSIVKLWLEHLTELGHQHIAHLHGVTDQWYIRSMHERLRFFYEESARLGLVAEPDLCLYGGFTPEQGYEATEQLFATGKKFTAIIVNDAIVSGVYRSLMERGLEIGKDISVIGSDDMEWCSHMIPPLTTLYNSRLVSAEITFDKLIEVFESGGKPFDEILIPVELHVRASTGPAKQ